MIESDHRPAVIKVLATHDKGIRPFHYDTRLGTQAGFNDVVKRGWNENINGCRSVVTDRIISCRKEIYAWKRTHNINSAKQIKWLSREIDQAHTDGVTTVNEIRSMRSELSKAYKEEDIFWKTKSRNQWLKEGDRNTRFFHASTKNRRARNKIDKIIGPNWEEIKGNTAIGNEATRFFSDLFTSSGVQNLQEVLCST